METFESGTVVALEMGLPMDMVAEEVVSQDEGGADSDCQTAAVDSLTSQPSFNMHNKFGKELVFPGDSSEDEDNPAMSRIYASGQNAAEKGTGDVWTGRMKDDCLCWECGERFYSLERLMVHFRKHKACVRCNMCQVTFRRVVSLSMHLDNVHNNVDLYCTPCRRPFHSKWDLNEHLGKHFDPGEPPITLGLSPPCPEALEETEVCLVTSDMEEEPIPEPLSLLVSVPVSRAIPVSAPAPLSAPTPVPVSVPKCLPVSRPVPLSAPMAEPKSAPASASVPVSVPKSAPASAPISVSVPEYPSTSLPVSRALPLSAPNSGPVPAPVPLAAPVSVPIYLPLAIPLSLPMAAPIPTSVPGPISEPVPMSAPVSTASSTSSLPSAVQDHDSTLDESILPELVARDHTYNSYQADNGAAAGTYSLRHTKRRPKSHPQHSLPASAQKNKRHLSVFRNMERVARVGVDRRDRHMKEVAEEREVKPAASSLIPLLPHSSVSLELGAEFEHEGIDPCSNVVPWDGEPIEEDEDLDHSVEEEEQQSDGSMSHGDCSEYSPGSASESSSESISSGNSSGSSYTPNKRGKRVKTRRRLRVKKRMKAALSQVVIAPARKPVATDFVKPPQSIRDQPKLQHSIQAAVKQNVVEVFAPGGNKTFGHPSLRPSRMYACDQCREVFPEQVTYRRHHCPVKTASIMSWSTTASTPVPSTTAAPVQKPAAAPIPAPGLATTIKTPSTSGLVSTTGKMLNSSSGVMKVTQMAIPGTIPNSTLMSSVPVASGPVFTLPSFMLPSPSPSVQSGSQPVMTTVVFNGSAGRVARLVLQSQGLTFPTHTLSQSQPISLSVPIQANASTAGQASPSVQLANLMIGGLIQPQTLGKSPHLTSPSAPSTIPVPAHIPASPSKPDPVLIPAPIHITGPTSGPVTALTPTSVAGPVPISALSLTPATASGTTPVPKTVPTPISAPASKTVTTLITADGPKTVPTPSTASVQMPVLTTLNSSVSSPDSEPLRILGMFANRSQELSLEKRLEKNWRSKGVFLCRQCGAISRQPSLGVRHRYLHQGSRRHRCHCGRTFLHRLHLLRHHVQHAEATRFVCAPCGQTFSGARCLARHKQDREGKRKKRVRSRKDCHTPFSCDCGQIFQRPAAFLWHKLKNPKQRGVSLKRTEGAYPSRITASQIETCPL